MDKRILKGVRHMNTQPFSLTEHEKITLHNAARILHYICEQFQKIEPRCTGCPLRSNCFQTPYGPLCTPANLLYDLSE